MQEFFKLSISVVDSEELSIYEKMCCVVLARLYDNDNLEDISIEILARKMSVEEIVAKGAFYSLMSKGILELADKSQLIKPGTIIKAPKNEPEEEVFEELIDDIVEEAIPEFSNNDIVLTQEEKLQRVCEIVQEKISVREAQIILSFANGDIKKIIEKYKIAKASQYKDKIELLLHELQKKEERISSVIKSTDINEDVTPFESQELEEDLNLQKTQLNTYKINQMRKYKQK